MELTFTIDEPILLFRFTVAGWHAYEEYLHDAPRYLTSRFYGAHQSDGRWQFTLRAFTTVFGSMALDPDQSPQLFENGEFSIVVPDPTDHSAGRHAHGG